MANQALVKRINRARVLNAIRRSAPMSRSRLADLLGLDRKSITNLVSQMLAEGLVAEAGTVRSGQGRPQTLLALRSTSWSIMGLSISGDGVAGVLTGLGGECRARARRPFAPESPLPVVLAAVRAVHGHLRQAADGEVRRIGVAFPGILDVATGLVERSVTLQAFEGATLTDRLRGILGEALVFAEHSSAKALAEKWFGMGKETPSFACIDLGLGVGAGLIQDRRVYAPPGGYAGEIGHIIVEPEGATCRCGRRGCLEAYLSETAILAGLNRAAGSAWHRLDEVPSPLPAPCQAVLQRAGYRLGRGLSYLANILCPPLIILNGNLMRFADAVMPAVEQGLADGALPACRERIVLAASRMEDAAAMGAAAKALSEFYEVEGHVCV